MSDDELQRYVALLQQYQAQAEYIQQQLSMLQLSVQGLDDAIASLEVLGSQGNREVLVPLGAGTFVFSNVSDTNRVLLGIGAGVALERDRDTSLMSLRSHRDDLEVALKRGTDAYTKVVSQMEELQAKVQQMLPGQEA